MGIRLFLAGLLALCAWGAHAQTVVIASAPTETSVTIYRAPFDRFGGDGSDARDPPRWLAGYALIGETRDIDLPAGPAVIRFPGVAAGMLAESVVVSGLPTGVREKNLDAQLLSPRSLYAGWFGRPVTLRREDPESGKMREQPAVIRSGPDGAAIIETDQGFEAMTCGPFTDSIAFPGTPDHLYSSPNLSIATEAPAATHVRLHLTYLAWNYDWHADYVLQLAPDLRHAKLSAWVTLASADVTSFPLTSAAVVAGKPNFSEARDRSDGDRQDLTYQCFPKANANVPTPPPGMPMPVPAPMMANEIVVTAMRKAAVTTNSPVTMAQAENLGDLKLFRLPQPTTVAAHEQKQIALFAPHDVSIKLLHVAALDDLNGSTPAQLLVRTRNRKEDGLGLALPGGRVRVLAEFDSHELIVGEGTLADRTINDRVEIGTASTPQVTVSQTQTARGTRTASVSNANPFAVQFEGTFKQTPQAQIHETSSPLVLRDGHRVWSVRIPANGRAVLHYRMAAD